MHISFPDSVMLEIDCSALAIRKFDFNMRTHEITGKDNQSVVELDSDRGHEVWATMF